MRHSVTENKTGADYYFNLIVKKWLLVHYMPSEAYKIVRTRQFYSMRGFHNTLAAKYLRTCCINNELWAKCEMLIKNYIITQDTIMNYVVAGKDISVIKKYNEKKLQYEASFFELTGKSIVKYLYDESYAKK